MIDIAAMPKLGFGFMRLPQTDEGQIDLPRLTKMVDAYLERGFNYFDTAYVYHGGQSEAALRKAVVERYPRDRFMVADKLPAWSMSGPEDADRIFAEQLKRTGLDYFDFYLLHSVEDGANYEKHEEFGSFDWAKRKVSEGKIRHFGFSFHGTPELLVQVLDKHPEVEFVQIQLNYADWDNQVTRSGELYEILRERNLPIIVMEPVKGGTLARLEPKLADVLRSVRPDASEASWALRFVGSLPGVATILSGMSAPDQMADNLGTFADFEPLSPEERDAIDEVVRRMHDLPLVPCTACRYCTDGCPMRIAIPDVFSALNTKRLYPDDNRPRMFYKNLVKRGNGAASTCIACGQCEGVCPQHLPIIDLLQEAAEKLEA